MANVIIITIILLFVALRHQAPIRPISDQVLLTSPAQSRRPLSPTKPIVDRSVSGPYVLLTDALTAITGKIERLPNDDDDDGGGGGCCIGRRAVPVCTELFYRRLDGQPSVAAREHRRPSY